MAPNNMFVASVIASGPKFSGYRGQNAYWRCLPFRASSHVPSVRLEHQDHVQNLKLRVASSLRT